MIMLVTPTFGLSPARGKVVNEFYYVDRFPRVVMTKRTEEEDASHWHV